MLLTSTQLRWRTAALFYAVPGAHRLVSGARTAIFGTVDALDRMRGHTDPMIPPKRLGFVGGGDFKTVGALFLRSFIHHGLHPDHDVLDIGCGIGRMAVPLTHYLSDRGSYEGFDVVPAGIEWCTEHITPRFPKFGFRLIDVYNRRYSPDGDASGNELPFPYHDNAFDFAIATSVFTHMLPDSIDHYVSELARVLRPGGRVFATYFLDPTLEPGDASPPRPLVEFSVQAEGYRTINRRVPEFAIAFPEHDVRRRYRRSGFVIESVIPGSWSGRHSGGRDVQDVVVVRLAA